MADINSDAWRDDRFRDSMTDFLKEYRGWTFEFKKYRRWREGWEHDHCIACGQVIAESGAREDAITEAYAVSDRHPRGAEYEWLCPPCAHMLASTLGLRLVGEAKPV
jgi:hypothetical protein